MAYSNVPFYIVTHEISASALPGIDNVGFKLSVCICTSACVVPMGHNFLTLLILNKQSINQFFGDIN